MTGPSERWRRWRARTTPYRPPATIGAGGTLTLGAHRFEWCPICADFTLITAPAYLLGRSGVTHLGTAATCETCGWTPGAHHVP